MDSLLCDEEWLSSPAIPCHHKDHKHDTIVDHEKDAGVFYTTKEDYEEALSVYLEKELSYMPKPGYLERLCQSTNLSLARYKAIHWLIKSQSRLNISFATVFSAANYLDRLLSMNQSQDLKYWMVELLSLSCLSIASKFCETSTPSLDEIQEDMDHSFHPVTIQRMELALLQALGWRLGSPTAYSYVELFTASIHSFMNHLQKDLVSRLSELLLGTIVDWRMVEYQPSIVAASALWCTLEELGPSNSDAHLVHITRFFNQDHKDDLVKCHNIMKVQLANYPPFYNNFVARGNCPSSPVTVLLTEEIGIYNQDVDLSFFKIPKSSNALVESNKKRRRREEQ
ncbi:hypothetical protein Tsubulata_028900 [Turnera subulata]|uniref:B-like cyclin n=1 Tax=Turnera subulata TaxID=218843 RepID=A0A9Q0GG61_9ROSI|nr:hypothetical protein Tsubulata_028900 [Turnera subulata]